MSPILFRVTYDERLKSGVTARRERITASLDEALRLLDGLATNTERYSNVKRYAATIEWAEV